MRRLGQNPRNQIALGTHGQQRGERADAALDQLGYRLLTAASEILARDDEVEPCIVHPRGERFLELAEKLGQLGCQSLSRSARTQAFLDGAVEVGQLC